VDAFYLSGRKTHFTDSLRERVRTRARERAGARERATKRESEKERERLPYTGYTYICDLAYVGYTETAVYMYISCVGVSVSYVGYTETLIYMYVPYMGVSLSLCRSLSWLLSLAYVGYTETPIYMYIPRIYTPYILCVLFLRASILIPSNSFSSFHISLIRTCILCRFVQRV